MRQFFKHTGVNIFILVYKKHGKRHKRNNGLNGIWANDFWNTVTNALPLSYQALTSVPLENLVCYNNNNHHYHHNTNNNNNNNIIYYSFIKCYCVVPENIQTPPRRKSHLGSPTPLDFPFLQETDDPPTRPEFPQVWQRPPNPSGKVHFHEERLLE